MTIHGVLIKRDGKGTLIVGPPGSGKSSIAIESLLNGGQLVADDIVEIGIEGKMLMGQAPAKLVGMVALPEVGIFDVRDVFGSETYAPSAAINELLVLDGSHFCDRPFQHDLTPDQRLAAKRSELKFIGTHDAAVAARRP